MIPGRYTRRAVLHGLSGATLSALMGLSTAGCATTRPAGPSVKDSDFGRGGRGRISFWARADVGTISKKMVELFHEAQSDIQVDLTLIPGTQLVTKLATSIRGGTQPDVFGFDDFFGVALSYYGALTDVTDAVKRLPFASALNPAMQATLRLDGRLYGVPYDSDLSAYWYNKELFERAQLDPDAPPTSFEGMVDAAEAIAKRTDAKGIAFPGVCGPCLAFVILPSIWAGPDGEHLIMGEPGRQRANFEGNKSLERVLSLYHRAWTSGSATPSSRTQTGATWGADFREGRVGLFPGGYGSVVGQVPAHDVDKFGLAPLPGPLGGKATFTGGDNLGVPAGAKNPSLAWEFIQFVLSEKAQLALPELGFTPVRGDLLTDSYRQKYPLDTVLLGLQDQGYIERSAVANIVFSQPSGAFPAMFSSAVFTGDIRGAMQQGQSDAQAALAEVNKR